MEHLHGIQTSLQRLADNSDLPLAPTAIAVRQGAGKVVEIQVTFAEPVDWGQTELWRGTTNDVTAASKITSNKSHIFHDTNVSYGTLYYYWARVVGISGNTGGYSPSSGHSITVSQVLTADVADLNITTGKINSNDVTTEKRQGVNVQSNLLGTIGPGAGSSKTFTVATGAINLITAFAAPTSGNKTLSVYFDDSSSSAVTVWVFNWATSGDAVGVTVTVHYW